MALEQNRTSAKQKFKVKKKALLFVLGLLVLTYYLSSIPNLRVLPVLREINQLLVRINLGFSDLARIIAGLLPSGLESVGTITGEFLQYARQNPVIIEFLLRKTAHIALFFVITLAFFMFWRHYLKPLHAVLAASACGTLTAIIDETYQHFVIGRSGIFTDVLIDLIGVFLAIILIAIAFLLVKPVYSNRNQEPTKNPNNLS
jgi:VanZ family protein